MYKLRHALPRIIIWLWGVRNGCARVTQWLRHYPQSRPWKWQVHIRGQALHTSWTLNVSGREQSADAANPRRSLWQWPVLSQAMVRDMANPRRGQRHRLSISAARSNPRLVHNQRAAGACPTRCDSFPYHCRQVGLSISRSFPIYVLI